MSMLCHMYVLLVYSHFDVSLFGLVVALAVKVCLELRLLCCALAAAPPRATPVVFADPFEHLWCCEQRAFFVLMFCCTCWPPVYCEICFGPRSHAPAIVRLSRGWAKTAPKTGAVFWPCFWSAWRVTQLLGDTPGRPLLGTENGPLFGSMVCS